MERPMGRIELRIEEQPSSLAACKRRSLVLK
jgi:hypothetical protein